MEAGLARLEEVYATRPAVARALADAGRRVVGVVGADVPPELVDAAGGVAYRLHGHPDRITDEARDVLGPAVDPVAHSILSQVLDGSLGFLTGLVVSRDSQASLQLFYAMRELRRLDPDRPIPPVHLLDLLHLPTARTTRYDEVRLRQLAAELEGWTGTAVTAERLEGSVRAVGEVRDRLRAVAGLREGPAPALTGTQVLRAFGAATVLPPEDARELLDGVLADARPGAVEVRGRRVFLTGSAQDCDDLYVALEHDLGHQVVGEDHDRGALALTVDVASADLGSLAVGYRDRGPSAPTAAVPRRARWTAQQAARCGADLLLGVVREHDEAPAWDWPAQHAAAGLPGALLARQSYRVPTGALAAALHAAAPAGAGGSLVAGARS